MNMAAGSSAAIFATNARRTVGELAVVSPAAVKRVSPYATKTSGTGSAESGMRKVAAASAAPPKISNRYKTTRKQVRIARCYGLGGSQTMKLLFAVLLCIPAVAGAAATAPGEKARWQQHAQQVH